MKDEECIIRIAEKFEESWKVPFNYKDLIYIRAVLQYYESALIEANSSECCADTFFDAREDIRYMSRLISRTNHAIQGLEFKASKIKRGNN